MQVQSRRGPPHHRTGTLEFTPGPGGSIFLLRCVGSKQQATTRNGEKREEKFTEQLDTTVAFLRITVSSRYALCQSELQKQFRFQFGTIQSARASSEERKYALTGIGA